MNKDSAIFVAGHNGLVGSALVAHLESAGYRGIITASRSELDLTCQTDVAEYLDGVRPEVVFLCAAKVGGILANDSYPAEFLYDNLQIQMNVIHNAWLHGAKKLVFLGSSCIYPKLAEQPIAETALLTGPLEPTNRSYAIAKIAGIEACRAYRKQHGFDAISVMPTNLYGPGDNFDPLSSHVLAALVRKFVDAVDGGRGQVEIWGTGCPRREFLHVSDLASACEFLALNYSEELPINVGLGKDISIHDLAMLIGELTGFEGELVFDETKPDGTPRKLLDVSRLSSLGWVATTTLRDGLAETIEWYRQSDWAS